MIRMQLLWFPAAAVAAALCWVPGTAAAEGIPECGTTAAKIGADEIQLCRSGDFLVGASSILPNKKRPTLYAPQNLGDDKPFTAWVEGQEDDGLGEKVAFMVPGDTRFIAVLPGYGKEGTFQKNNRVRAASLTLYETRDGSNGTFEIVRTLGEPTNIEFEDAMELQNIWEHTAPASELTSNKENTIVGVLEIKSVYRGSKYRDTCISEIQLNPHASADAFVQVSSWLSHTCGLTRGGRLECWGSNRYGQSNDDPGPYSYVDVYAYRTCAASSDKGINCFGERVKNRRPPPIEPFRSFRDAGWYGCGVTKSGSAKCWGTHSTQPPSPRYEAVSVVHNYACGLRTDGKIECWGDRNPAKTLSGTFKSVNVVGDDVCGLQTSGRIACSKGVTFTPPKTQFSSVSITSSAGCGITKKGALSCWTVPRKGPGTVRTPLPSPPDGTFTSVSVGFEYACAIDIRGRVACWGKNDSGQSSPPKQ